MITDLSSEGKLPVTRDALTIWTMTGARTVRTSWRRRVGIGSKRQVAFEAFFMIDVISAVSVGLSGLTLTELVE